MRANEFINESKAEYNMLRQLAKAADAKSIAASDELNKFPKGEMGLIPDSVKSDPAWQKAKKEFDSSFAELRHYNSLITKNYKKEHKAARDEERAARYDKPVTEDDGYGERKFKITYGGGNNYRNTRVIHADSKEEAEAWVNKWLGRPIETQEITTEREMFPDVRTYTPQEIAQKHDVPVQAIMKQLQMGIEVEYEHTKNKDAATEIALDHILELPDYYTRLAKMEHGLVEEVSEFVVKITGLGDWDDADHNGYFGGGKGNIIVQRLKAAKYHSAAEAKMAGKQAYQKLHSIITDEDVSHDVTFDNGHEVLTLDAEHAFDISIKRV